MRCSSAANGGEGLHRRGAHADVHRFLRTRQECHGIIIAAHEKSLGGPEKSFEEELKSAASTALPLRPPPDFFKRLRYGRHIPKRGQHQRIRSPACSTVPNLWSTRLRHEGHWPRADRIIALARAVRSRRSTERPWIEHRCLRCRCPAQRDGCAGDVEGPTDGAHWRNAASQERESLSRPPRRQLAQAGSRRGESSRSNRTARTANQGRKGQGSRGRPRLDHDLHDAGPAQHRDRARCSLPNQSGWPFFCNDFLFFCGSRVHKFCQRENRHSSRPSHCMAASDPDVSQPAPSTHCDRHEARAGTVALKSCCLVRLSTGGLALPACTQQTVCRGGPPASRLDPLASRGDKRGRSKAQNSLCSTGHLSQIHLRDNGKKPPSPLAPLLASCAWGARLLPTWVLRRAWSRPFILRCGVAGLLVSGHPPHRIPG